MTSPPCPTCNRRHESNDGVHLIGRFSLLVPLHAANYDGAPHRETHDEAVADMCAHYRRHDTKEAP